MDVVELRGWIEDALTRHQRDARERDEALTELTTDEIVDAVWGRLPLTVRREASRAQVQASLTMLTLRHRFGAAAPGAEPTERPELVARADGAPAVDGAAADDGAAAVDGPPAGERIGRRRASG